MKTSWKISRSLAILLPIFLTACTGVRAPKEPRADKYSPSQIHVDSEELRNDTAVGTPMLTRGASDLLHVTIPIRSAIDKKLYVDYWITWFDETGAVINKFGPQTKTLQPNTPDSISVTSTTPRARNFQLDLRYAH